MSHLSRVFVVLLVGLLAALPLIAEQDGPLKGQDPAAQDAELLDALQDAGALTEAQVQATKKSWKDDLASALKPTADVIVAYTPWNEMKYDEVISYPGSPDKERGFAIREASFGLDGRIYYDWLRFRITASAEQQDDGELAFGLEYAYIKTVFTPKKFRGTSFEPTHGFTLGAMKVPFSRQLLTSESKLQFINRAMVLDELGSYRDIGLTFDASYFVADGLFNVYLNGGAFNGQGHRVYAADNNDDLLYAARLRFDLLSPMKSGEGDTRASFLTEKGLNKQLSIHGPQLSIGGSFRQNNDIDRMVRSWGGDAEFRWMGISVSGEYVWTRYEPDLAEDVTGDAIADEWETEGWYVQGGFFVWPKHLEVAARYEKYTLDLLTDIADERVLANTTVGINFHVARGHGLKLMANWIQRAELEGLPELDNDSVTIQASAQF